MNNRFNQFVEKMKKNLDGVMDFALDVNYDKKKTSIENSQTLYESMFKKNIPQHKTISKFLFSVYGTKNLLEQKLKRIKKVTVAKLEKTTKQKQPPTTSHKLNRLRRIHDRPQSSQPKTKVKEDLMIQTIIMDKKGKMKRKPIYPSKITKFIKVF